MFSTGELQGFAKHSSAINSSWFADQKHDSLTDHTHSIQLVFRNQALLCQLTDQYEFDESSDTWKEIHLAGICGCDSLQLRSFALLSQSLLVAAR